MICEKLLCHEAFKYGATLHNPCLQQACPVSLFHTFCTACLTSFSAASSAWHQPTETRANCGGDYCQDRFDPHGKIVSRRFVGSGRERRNNVPG